MTEIQNEALTKAQWVLDQAKREDLKLMQIKQDFGDGDVSIARDIEKRKFSQMKYGLLEMEARHTFLTNLNKDPSSWLTQEEADAEVEEISAKLKSAKSENSDLQARINLSLESAVEGYGKLQAKIEKLEKKIQELEVAKEKLEILRVRHEEAKSVGSLAGEQGGYQEKIQSQTANLSSTNATLETCRAAISSSRQELNRMKIMNGNLRREIELKTEILVAKQQTAQSSHGTELESVERVISRLNQLDGTELEVQRSDQSSLVVEIRDGPQSPSLSLTMHVITGANGTLTVKHATVKEGAVRLLPQSVLDDLVQAYGHSVQSLIFHVRKCWQKLR